jgi:hypothetical protein
MSHVHYNAQDWDQSARIEDDHDGMVMEAGNAKLQGAGDEEGATLAQSLPTNVIG